MQINCTCIFLLLVFLQVASATNAQKITINKKNASLSELFTEIRKQTKYDFVLPKDLMKIAQPVSIQVSNTDITEVLRICFKNQPLSYKINDKVIIVIEKEQTDLRNLTVEVLEIDVRGKIVNEKGETLQSATVTIKGTTRTVITDSAGEFLFKNVDEKAVLVISYLGYRTVEVKTKANLGNIVMQVNPAALTEIQVVSTGYQTLPKERATGSFSLVDNKTFNEQVSTNILSRLEPVANGLTTVAKNSGRTILRVRGISTINGPGDPLIILDNFPYEGNINNINPNDIENITVLKDAAAASIWGARAGNGVIVITTKKAGFNKPMAVTVNSSVTITGKPDLYYRPAIASTDIVDFEQFLFSQKYRFSDTSSINRPAFSQLYEILFKKNKSAITAEEADRQIARLRNSDLREEFLNYMYQRAVNQQYAISISGGSAKNASYFSMGYDKNIGNLNEQYRRLNLRFDNTYALLRNLKLSTGIYVTNAGTENGRLGYNQLFGTTGKQPYIRLADENGNPLPFAKTLRQIYTDTVGKGKLLDWNYYPLTENDNIRNRGTTWDIMATAGLNYRIINGLSIDIKYQYQHQMTRGRTEYTQGSYYTRDMINRFSQVNYSTGAITYPIPLGSILELSISRQVAQGIRGQLNYDKIWGKHAVNAILGWENRQVENNSEQNRTYGYNADILTFSTIDYVTRFRTYPRGSTAVIPEGTGFTNTLSRHVSNYGNVAYVFDGKYTLSASARRDGSNIFGASTNNKWKPLWSAGASWEISKEGFYRISFLPYLRVRATYGYSGNMDPSQSAVTTLAYMGTSIYTGTPEAFIDKINNPELRWEKVRMINFGLDYGLLNNRLSGSIEYYEKKATDLFADVPIDYTAGLNRGTLIKNIGIIGGRGLDIQINSKNFAGKAFAWQTTLNFSFNKDEIIDVYSAYRNNTSNIILGLFSGIKGRPVTALYSYKWAGLDPANGAPRGYINGEIKNSAAFSVSNIGLENVVYNGPAFATFFGSVINSFRFKDITLTASIVLKGGNYFRRQSISYTNLQSIGNGHADYYQRWQKPGDEQVTNVPALIYPISGANQNLYQNADILVEKADLLRLQYVTVTYNIRAPFLDKAGLKTSQIYCNLNNVGLLWTANRYNIDPEFSNSDFTPQRSFSVGLRVGF